MRIFNIEIGKRRVREQYTDKAGSFVSRWSRPPTSVSYTHLDVYKRQLLCYEDVRKGESDWCHRTMFAKWWFEKTGEVIPELPDPSTPKISKAKMKAAVEQTTLF